MTVIPKTPFLQFAQCYREGATTGDHAGRNTALKDLAQLIDGDVLGRARATLAASLAAAEAGLPGDADETTREQTVREAMIGTWKDLPRLERAALLNDSAASPHEIPAARSASEIDDPRPSPILSPAGKFCTGAVLSEGEICLLAGEGGVGKSALAGEIALAVAGNARGAGGLLAVHGGGPVLWVTYEETPGELAARLKTRARAVGVNARNVHVLDMRGGWPLFGPGADGRSSAFYHARPEQLIGWEPMEAAVGGLEPRLIVIDPVLAAYVGEPNSAPPVREFLGALASLAREHSAGVLVLAHSTKAARSQRGGTKPDPFEPGQVAGSAAWTDGVRGALSFAYGSDDDGNRLLSIVKANMGPARIQCDAKPMRAEESGWIIGFEAAGAWRKPRGAAAQPPETGSSGATDGSELD